jgi:hypothetical protein
LAFVVPVPVLKILSAEVIESVLYIMDQYLIHMALESEQKVGIVEKIY